MRSVIHWWNGSTKSDQDRRARRKGQAILDLQTLLNYQTSESQGWELRGACDKLRRQTKTKTCGSNVHSWRETISQRPKRELQASTVQLIFDVRSSDLTSRSHNTAINCLVFLTFFSAVQWPSVRGRRPPALKKKVRMKLLVLIFVIKILARIKIFRMAFPLDRSDISGNFFNPNVITSLYDVT